MEIRRESISIKDSRISHFLAYLPAASSSCPSQSVGRRDVEKGLGFQMAMGLDAKEKALAAHSGMNA